MDDIHSTFDELQKTLNVRKSVLLMELEVNYGLKHKVRLQPFLGHPIGGLILGLPDASLLFHQQQRGLKWVLKCHCCLVRSSFYLERAMAPHSSTLAWKIPLTEEPGGPQSMGLLRVGQD